MDTFVLRVNDVTEDDKLLKVLKSQGKFLVLDNSEIILCEVNGTEIVEVDVDAYIH